MRAALKAAKKRQLAVEEQHTKMTTALRYEIESKDSDLERMRKETLFLEGEKMRSQRDLTQAQKSISDLISEKQEIARNHYQELADLKLKHEQESYILRKMKR